MSFPALSHVPADVFHGRRGRTNNDFRYRTDFLWLEIGASLSDVPGLLSRNRFNIWSLRDRNYGDGSKTLETRAGQLRAHAGLSSHDVRTFLLTQPTCLGYGFNPVSFWFFIDHQDRIRAVVSEVNNTCGDRHSYLSAHADGRPVGHNDTLTVKKIFYVSPFQPVDGAYAFSFSLGQDKVSIRIGYESEADDGLQTSVSGPFQPLTNAKILKSVISLPAGALRVMALIHWQALRLFFKGATFRPRPNPPAKDFSS